MIFMTRPAIAIAPISKDYLDYKWTLPTILMLPLKMSGVQLAWSSVLA
jgi:hypothetical protein